MRVLFLHPNFPAQFRHLATLLSKDPKHQVVFGTKRKEGSISGVTKMLYQPSREVRAETHHYVRTLESAVLEGQAVYRVAQALRQQGFVPDVVYAHSGWGPGLFAKDLFPQAKLCCFFEWYYHAHGTDADFDPADPIQADDEARIRMKNTPILLDLASCDAGLCPTEWQRVQFPPDFHTKLKVLHDGIDTDYFQPVSETRLALPEINLDLTSVDELVTYVGRGMEPYRGFPQFMKAVELLQKRRPQTHVVVVGEDRVAYGKKRTDGKTYKQAMLEELDLDLSRLHFTGRLPYDLYLKVLQASSVHVYLTRPFVLSWSMLEAMSTGCLIVGSNTQPVQEAITDGENGLLTDFFDVEAICDRIEYALENPEQLQHIRQNARQTILERYDLAKLLPEHLNWLLSTSPAQS